MIVRGRLMGVALLLMPALGIASATPDCTQGLLQRLGWRFDEVTAGAPQVHGGPVCTLSLIHI